MQLVLQHLTVINLIMLTVAVLTAKGIIELTHPLFFVIWYALGCIGQIYIYKIHTEKAAVCSAGEN